MKATEKRSKSELLAIYEIQSTCIELAFHVGTYIHDFQKYSPAFRASVIKFLGGVAQAMGELFKEEE